MNRLLPQTIPANEILSNPPKPLVFAFFLGVTRLALHPSIVYEEGAEFEMQAHKKRGGNTLFVMTHFEKIGPGHLGSAAISQEFMSGFAGTTVVTAKRSLSKKPVLGFFIKSVGVEWVDRRIENQGESRAERMTRQAGNRTAVETEAQYLAAGGNGVWWPEGTTKINIFRPDGSLERRDDRPPGALLPIQDGVGEVLGLLTSEQRDKLRLVGVAEHFGERFMRLFRPSLAFTRPEVPVEGTPDDWVEQTRVLMQRGLDLAMLHDAER